MMLHRFGLPLLAALASPLALSAQAAPRAPEPLKQRPVVVRMRSDCAASVVQISSPTDAQRRAARDMAQRARQSAILGDAAAERSQLRDAARLDPTDATIAYALARAYENAGASPSAAVEYCRFLSLVPNATEAVDVRAHIATLVSDKLDTVVTAEGAAFKRGADAYDKGQWADAERLFTTVIEVDSTSADVFYDRALVRALQSQRGAAADDYERYLRLRPEASDHAVVVARVNQLRQRPLSAARALRLGAMIPGGGQFYAGRPIRGGLSAAGFGVAAALAVTAKTRSVTTTQTSTDPFGNRYNYPVTTAQKSHPYLLPGFGAAVGIALWSAIDAALYVRAAGLRSVSVSVVPSGNGVGALASVSIP